MKNPCPLPLGPALAAGVGAIAYCLVILATVGCERAGGGDDTSPSSENAEGVLCSCDGSLIISSMLTVAPIKAEL